MIIVYHNKGIEIMKVETLSGESIQIDTKNPVKALLDIGSRFPEKWVVWCQIGVESLIDFDKLGAALHHKAIMVSDLRMDNPVPKDIQYVEESPFVKVALDKTYPTWQMSSTIGAIHGSVLIQLKGQISENTNLDFALNSIARQGQSQGLFCYHSPLLTNEPIHLTSESSFNSYAFIRQTFKKRWMVFLFLCHLIFEKRMPLLSFVKGVFFSQRSISLVIDHETIRSTRSFSVNPTVDVIIPTMGRTSYLYDVLKDFSEQTLLPQNIIIVEQNTDPSAVTVLDYLTQESWPFKIVHHFIHETGACNARNIALKETTAEWVFYADDDNRFDSKVIENALVSLKKYGKKALTTSYLQKGEQKEFTVPKQWTTFGSGNSFVQGTLSRKLFFDTAYEHGYGEDADYGMQLRNEGVDILYCPDIDLQHLKAPVGGFRNKIEQPWESEIIAPKPSPTVMLFRLKHATPVQLKGYKLRLFLRQLNQQKPLHLVRFIRHYKKGWNTSIKWAKKLGKE